MSPRWIFAAMVGPLVALSGCGGTEDAAGQGTIRLQVSGEPEEIAVYRALVTAYEKAHAGAKVQLVGVAKKDDHLARLSTSFAAGNPPDAFLINYREYAQFVARGALKPAGPLLTEQGVKMADYYPQPVEAFTYGGALQCMPQNISSLVVYYNRALFDRAGVTYPKAGWTWDDFESTAAKLTRGNSHGLGMESSLIRAAPFVWGNGGTVTAGEPPQLTLSSPKAREALNFLLGLKGSMPDKTELAAQDLETRFTSGKLGMLLSSRRDTPAFREVAGLDFDVAPLPVKAQPAGILHSDGYCVAAKSSQQEAAARFIAFAVGKQGQTITALGGRTVPSLISVAKSGAFLDPARAPKSSQVFLDGIPAIKRTPVHPRWTEVEEVVETELTRAFQDGASLDDVLGKIDSRTRQILTTAS